MNTTDVKPSRYDFVDLLKGFGIFLVVWGHTMMPRSAYIYSFHMPFFFFLSGFVHKDKPLRSFILAKIDSLYIPYLTFSLLSWLFYLVPLVWNQKSAAIANHLPKLFSLINGSADNGGNNPIWFLTCILVVSVIFVMINQTIKNTLLKTGLIIGLSIIGYTLGTKTDLPFQGTVALSGLVFYGLGYRVKQGGWLQRVDRFKPYQWIGLVILLELIHIASAYWNTDLSGIRRVNMAGNLLGNYYLFYLSALAGTAAYGVLGYKIGRVRLLNYLGVQTLIILAAHKPFLQIMEGFFSTHLDTTTVFYGLSSSVAAIILSLGLGYLLNRYTPFLLGKIPVVQPHINAAAPPRAG